MRLFGFDETALERGERGEGGGELTKKRQRNSEITQRNRIKCDTFTLTGESTAGQLDAKLAQEAADDRAKRVQPAQKVEARGELAFES